MKERAFVRRRRRSALLALVIFLTIVLAMLGCSGPEGQEEAKGRFGWDYDEHGEYALSDVESREFALSFAQEGVPEADSPECYLGSPIPFYSVGPDGSIEEHSRVYPRFRGERLTALIYVSKVMYRGAVGEVFVKTGNLDRFADPLESGKPCYIVECDGWGVGELLVSDDGEMRDAGNVAASSEALEAAKEDWRERMDKYIGEIAWWDPAERFCILAE